MTWKPCAAALQHLEEGGPFESAAYRRAAVAALPDVHDLSWAARASDGTTAAVALLGNRALAECVPPHGYGSIRSSRPLTSAEAASFLRAARRAAGARQLWFRTVELPAPQPADWSFASVGSEASVIPVSADRQPSERYSRLTRRSLKRAREAGGEVRTTGDARPFLRLYAQAATEWEIQYPHALIVELGRVGAARFDEVWIEGDVEAALMTLHGADHWMCWLAAQSPAGREVAASYLAYDRLLSDAAQRVPFVSLGASAPGTGGQEFKRRLGAVECASHRWETRNARASLGELWLRLRSR